MLLLAVCFCVTCPLLLEASSVAPFERKIAMVTHTVFLVYTLTLMYKMYKQGGCNILNALKKVTFTSNGKKAYG